MDFTGSLAIPPHRSFDKTVKQISKLLSINFSKDESGRFEEFPAFVGIAFGIEIAVLGIPNADDLDEVDPVTDYGLIVQSIADAADEDIETDLSVHLHSILNMGGVECVIGNA